ncbi:MAG TPA: 1-deoxy-D-xylulose-5-phosphate synthase [Sporichthya sp.]|nr:1-deoxy-D-xylulose-5-phosphate synthase [Sporichthya sp.]
MGLLESISGPADVKRLRPAQLETLAAEIRDFLIDRVSRTGGHLGPNLGAVELSIALHRVFDSPRDRIIWDTGHQAYVHKILTGRAADFPTLRQRGGMSGYPNRAESPHDVIENSHASTALSYADGLAKAYALRGELSGDGGRAVVAVVGDGALTGGMCWEALNNIAAAPDRPVIIVVNDNERSYAPTIGGLANHLSVLRTKPNYERFLRWSSTRVQRTPVVGRPAFHALHGMKKGLKDWLAPQGMFEDLGLKYVGPIDGHDVGALEAALMRARNFGGPVIVHAITRKGAGYAHAENDLADHFHGIGINDPLTGLPLAAKGGQSWTSVFAEEMVAVADERSDVVAITAAMLIPVGLHHFADKHPTRVFDVGIAEQHAVTSAAGLAMGGLHPVVAVYSTFLNRAFDQVLMDVALHGCGVTFVLDRAGVTGEDGSSHHGMWDLAMLQPVPGLRLAAPRDAAQLRAQLREALDVDDAPTVVRFPKGAAPEEIPAIERVGGVDVLHRAGEPDVLVIAVGAMATTCLQVAERLADQGVGVSVVDPRWVKPVDPALVALAREHRLVVTVEDSGRVGGVGSTIAQVLRDAGLGVPLRDFGIPAAFLPHGTRAEVLSELGLTPQDIAREVVEIVAGLPAAPRPTDPDLDGAQRPAPRA